MSDAKYFFCQVKNGKFNTKLFGKKCKPDKSKMVCRECPHVNGLTIDPVADAYEPTKPDMPPPQEPLDSTTEEELEDVQSKGTVTKEKKKDKKKQRGKKKKDDSTSPLDFPVPDVSCSNCGTTDPPIHNLEGKYFCSQCRDLAEAMGPENEKNDTRVVFDSAPKDEVVRKIAEVIDTANTEAVIKVGSPVPVPEMPKSPEEAITIIKGLGDSLAKHAYYLGKVLLWVKETVGHGNFGKWIETHVWFTARTAQRFMIHAENCDNAGVMIEYNPDPTKKAKGEVPTIRKIDILQDISNRVLKQWDKIVTEYNIATASEKNAFDQMVLALATELYNKSDDVKNALAHLTSTK